MTTGQTTIRVVPSASRLVGSLRDLGYDFPQAVADLVDNSITANAARVDVDLVFDGPDTWLRISDDGHGMSADAITEAMRYGSHQSYDEDDLGKFGLGLKTASLSQCRRLSIASRNGSPRARIQARVLDLDHVIDSDRWEILELGRHQRPERLVESLVERSGTVVVWESLDRLLGYKVPWGGRAASAVDRLSEQLNLHLGMVFHRFLSGDVAGRKRLRIRVNGKRVEPWDPFARNEGATVTLPASDIDISTPDGIGLVRFQPYVLPPREKFSAEESFHRLAGPRKWNAQQGLYIYRANRMIQSGGWSRMRALDEHVKLARASVDFYPDLDSAFEVNVAKVRVVLPVELREKLRESIEMLVRSAQATYREHSSSSGASTHARNARHRGNGAPQLALERVARRLGELKTLRRIIRELKQSDPEAARMLGL